MNNRMKRLSCLLLCVLLLLAAFAPAASAAVALQTEDGLFVPDEMPDAAAFMLISLDGGANRVIAQKNKDQRQYPASLTKIAAAAVALAQIRDLQETVTVSQRALDALADTGAQVAGLQAGDRVTYEELLYLTMVYSACDACQVLAEAVGGTAARFVEMMNDWAAQQGCTGTHFVNAHGLHEDDHYSTAADLARITLAALENDAFLRFAGATSYTFRGQTFLHTNVMLQKSEPKYYYAYAQGIKTGTTRKAGSCLITKGVKDGRSYLAVLLGSDFYYNSRGVAVKGVFDDARALFDWAFDALSERVIADSSREAARIPVLDGKDAESVALVPAAPVTALAPIAAAPEEFELRAVNAPATLEAPVQRGDTVCTCEIYYHGKLLAETMLVAADGVTLSVAARMHRLTAAFVAAHPLVTALLVLVVLAVLFLICILLLRARAQRRRRAARRRQMQRR